MTTRATTPEREKRLRIVHILNHTARLNGNVHAAIDLACAQAALGHKVVVCRSLGDFDDVLAKAGVETYTIDHLVRWGLPASVLRFGRFCKSWKPDVINAHMVTAALIALPAAKFLGIPLVATVHNEFEKSAALMGVADRVIAVSQVVGDSLVRRGISSDRIKIVLNGTIGSARHEQPPPGPTLTRHPTILSVAGQHPRKGIDHLLQAMRIVRNAEPQTYLYLVGEGPMQAEYEALAKSLDLQDCVTFTGGLEDPRPYMAAADIFVLASIADPAPLVLSEVRQFGCAIVATNVDGIPEMLDHGAAGVLVPPASPEILAQTIIALLRDADLRAEFGRRARAGIERFSVKRVAKDALAVYQDALRSHSPVRAQLLSFQNSRRTPAEDKANVEL